MKVTKRTRDAKKWEKKDKIKPGEPGVNGRAITAGVASIPTYI